MHFNRSNPGTAHLSLCICPNAPRQTKLRFSDAGGHSPAPEGEANIMKTLEVAELTASDKQSISGGILIYRSC